MTNTTKIADRLYAQTSIVTQSIETASRLQGYNVDVAVQAKRVATGLITEAEAKQYIFANN